MKELRVRYIRKLKRIGSKFLQPLQFNVITVFTILLAAILLTSCNKTTPDRLSVWRQAIVSLYGVKVDGDTLPGGGMGLLIEYTKDSCFLITAKHSVEKIIKLRFFLPEDGITKSREANLTGKNSTNIWRVHPDSTVDLASMLVPRESLNDTLVPIPRAWLKEDIRISEGDLVLFFEPYGSFGRKQLWTWGSRQHYHFLFIRHGIITRIPTEREEYQKTGAYFISSGNLHRGLSGGPVLLVDGYAKHKVVNYHFIGIISEIVPERKLAVIVNWKRVGELIDLYEKRR